MPIERTTTDRPGTRRRSARTLGALLALLVVGLGLSACLPQAGATDRITKLETRVIGDWTYDYYVNEAYPCAVSGYQTFVIGTRTGSSATATRPLWVKMHGGGAGWFAPDGSAVPNAGQKTQESFDKLLGHDSPGLMKRVKDAPQGFRVLIVSMCSHDVYGGMDTPDPYNPNTTPDGAPRPTNGLISTKAAIGFTTAAFPTDDFFLHGGSAGSAGSFHTAWSLQLQGLAPAGVVADSGVINQAWELWVAQNGFPGGTAGCRRATEDRGYGVLGRIHPRVGDPGNQPHLLIERGELTVPIAQVFNHADQNSCGDAPMPCPLPDGSNPVMQASDCRHQPVRQAIEDLGPGSRSVSFGLCVEGRDTTVPCDRHVVTNGSFTNTDPDQPADYNAAIFAWVLQRLGDD